MSQRLASDELAELRIELNTRADALRGPAETSYEEYCDIHNETPDVGS